MVRLSVGFSLVVFPLFMLSTLFVLSLGVAQSSVPIVLPVAETPPVVDSSERMGGERFGDADDPAIWVHPTNPEQSLVMASLKKGGLEVYDLSGKVVQSIAPEGVRYNNVDIAYGFSLADKTVDIVVASDRYKDNLAVFSIDAMTGNLEDITAPDNSLIFTSEGESSNEETTAYGLALYQNSGNTYAFVSRRETGDVAQLELLNNGQGQVSYTVIRTLSLPIPEGGELADAQIEGMVVDTALGVLYLGQENAGVWKVSTDPASEEPPTLLQAVGEILQADVEGLTIYYGKDSEGYLLVSSQGNNTFAVFTRTDNTYLGSFQVGDNADLDGSEACDGAQVINIPLGSQFSQGLLVVQDGNNLPEVMVEDNGEMVNVSTSFKYVPWENVAKAFNPPLLIDTLGYQVR
jgi:3-phytase